MARVGKQDVGGPPGGFAGILEGDPAEEASSHLDEDAARQAWDEGSAMSLEDVLRLAEGGGGEGSNEPLAVHSESSRSVGRVD